MATSSQLKSRRLKEHRRIFRSKLSDASTKQVAYHSSATMHKTRLSVWQQLDEYQREAVTFAINAKAAALFHEQGSGKTWILGGVVEKLHHDNFQAIIVVPLSNLESTWFTFFHTHLPYVPVYHTWDEFRSAPLPRTLIINYEGLPRSVQKARRLVFSLIVYDEAQRLKSRSSLASRTAAKLTLRTERRIIMSGTPMDKEPQDLWAQFRFLMPSLLGKWKYFEKEYLEWDMSRLNQRERKLVEEFKTFKIGSIRWRRSLQIIRILAGKPKFNFDKLPQFLEIIRPYALRVDIDDVIELPPLTIHRIPVRLRGQQRAMYDDLERTMFLRRPDVTAPMKATQLWKLQQIAGGYVIDDVGSTHEVGRAKLRMLKRIIKDRPIVVWCKYTEEIDSIYDEIDGAQRFTGRTKKRDRPHILEEFQSGKIDVLLCQVKTGGVGIDLFRSCVGIMYSYSHSWIDFDQMIKRLRRRGQKNPVDIYLLEAIDTVDEDIVTALMNKGKVTASVLTGLKRRWKNGC